MSHLTDMKNMKIGVKIVKMAKNHCFFTFEKCQNPHQLKSGDEGFKITKMQNLKKTEKTEMGVRVG